jgi:hypothetical protein
MWSYICPGDNIQKAVLQDLFSCEEMKSLIYERFLQCSHWNQSTYSNKCSLTYV